MTSPRVCSTCRAKVYPAGERWHSCALVKRERERRDAEYARERKAS